MNLAASFYPTLAAVILLIACTPLSAQAPKPEAPKPEAPKPEAPKPEAPKPEAPKPEAPKPEAPKPEAPKPEAPKPEASKPEAPKPEAPKLGLAAGPNQTITLPLDALGQDFLISASVIPQIVAPTSTALAGKVVRFEAFADGVDLYESTDGLVVTKELPAKRLLTTFPVVSRNESQIIIDFNAGMRRVFNDIWYASGGSGLGRGGLSESRSLEIPQARVFDVRTDGGFLIVRQSAQVRDRQMDPNREDRFEIRYFISPYQTGEFKGREHSPAVSRWVRFFESQPQIEPQTGRTSSRIALFDIRQPVTIYYSANTPAEFESAVRDGILYWNRAFGREVVKAQKAPEGVTAPDARYNLVQWVPWENAGFAYADVILDPRSGASRSGQAYMTSTFSFSGKARTRSLLRRLRSASEGAPVPAPAPTPGPSPRHADAPSDVLSAPRASGGGGSPIFATARACEVDPVEFSRDMVSGLESALADARFDDAAARRVSGDYVREVVAHEVGHMFGLRHNFAGSLAATLSHKELGDWFKAYLNDDSTKESFDRYPSSSVMEYTPFKAAVFIGWKIRRTKEVLPHDAAAIRWGYMGSTEVADKRMLFGTDDDVMRYGDVDRFDYGAEPLVGAYGDLAESIRNLPNSLIEIFIAAKAPRDSRDKRPLEQVNLSPQFQAEMIAESYSRILSWFRSNRRSLRVEHAFPFVGPLNQKEVLRAHWAALNSQVEKLGGVDRALFAFLPLEMKLELKAEPQGAEPVEKINAKRLLERLTKLLETPTYTQFTGLDDKPASFTKEDKELILKRAKPYFEEFETEFLKRVCMLFERAPRDLGVKALEELPEDDIVARLERRIVEMAREVIFARNEEKRHKGRVDRATVEVVDFRFDLEMRMAAARMLADQVGSYRNWAVEPRGELGKALKEVVDSSLNIHNFKEFKDAMLSRPLRDWYLNQQNLLGLLGYRPPMPMAIPMPVMPKPALPPGE
jgi:hypothetical protein